MPSSKAAIVGVSGSLDHWDTGVHVSGLIHNGTDASRRKEPRGQGPTDIAGKDVLFICQSSTLTLCKFQSDPGICWQDIRVVYRRCD